jgi:hypothetical protein
MNLNQINKIRMYQSTYLVLENHSSLFEVSEVFKTKHQVFKNGMQQLEHYRQIQEEATSGHTQEKEQVRDELTEIMLRVSAAEVAFATGTGNLNLKKKAHYVPSRLYRASDPVLYDIAENLHKLALPVAGELIIYFVDQPELDLLKEKTETFKMVMPQNRVSVSTRKTSTLNISKLIRGTDKLLKEELDAMMLPFRFSQPDFYREYKNARIIVDYSGRKKTPSEPEGEKRK